MRIEFLVMCRLPSILCFYRFFFSLLRSEEHWFRQSVYPRGMAVWRALVSTMNHSIEPNNPEQIKPDSGLLAH